MNTDSKDREWQRFQEQDKINYLLKQKLDSKVLLLKNSSPVMSFNSLEYTTEGIIFSTDYNPVDNELLTLCVTLARHIEVDFIFLKSLSAGSVLLKPAEARISTVIRSSKRIYVNDSIVHASNFRVPRDGALSGFGIKNSLTNQIIFEDFQKQYSEKIPGLVIYNNSSKDIPPEVNCLKDSHQKIFVSNLLALDERIYEEDSDLCNFSECVKKNALLQDRISKLGENGIASLAVVPIVSKTDDRGLVSVGYIVSSSKDILAETILETMGELSSNILFRMAEANSIPVKVSQKVVNISSGGVALEITDRDLMKSLPEKRKMIFDLTFSKQTPIRFQGDVCHIHESGDLLLAGVAFRGIGHTGTGTGNLKRLEKYIENLEKAV